MSTTPWPIAIEQAEPGELHEAEVLVDRVVVVGVEAGLVGVEGLRAVDVGDRDGDELELVVHAVRPLGAGFGVP